jgi:hypothetical protein
MRERKDQLPCDSSGHCLFGCSRTSIYNSAFEIPALSKFGNFEYWPKTFRRRLTASDKARHGVEIEWKGKHAIVCSDRVAVAAGTLVTTGLVVDRIGRAGYWVRLLSNPVAALAFVIPAR